MALPMSAMSVSVCRASRQACDQIGEAIRLRGEPLGVVWQIHDAQWLAFLGSEGSRKLREARVTADERG
jgi:hypothetical protein